MQGRDLAVRARALRAVPAAWTAAVVSAVAGMGAARADVPPQPKEGTKFVECTLEVFGLTDPNLVVVGLDLPLRVPDLSRVTVDGWLTLTAASPRAVLARAGRRGSHGPTLFMMTKAAYDAWETATTALIDAQREACASRREGCVHISRFVPSIPAPTAVIDCNQRIKVTLEVPLDGPDRVANRLRVVEASPTACRLEQIPADAPDPAPVPAPAAPRPQ